jgi:hypothetical protein
MPYSATYSIGYGIGVTELVVRSNVYSSQAAPLTNFLGGSLLKSSPVTVTNFTSTGNSIITTGTMTMTAPPSQTDFYGGFTGNVINCSEIVGGNIIGQVLSLNSINVSTNVITTGNIIALVSIATRANAYTNLISAANIYTGTYIGTVTGQSVSTLASLTALSTLTVGGNLIGNVLTTGTVTVTGQVTGNILAGSNTITTLPAVPPPPPGTALWATRIAGISDDSGYGISVDGAGNSYITGQYGSDPLTIYNVDTSTFGTLTGNPAGDVFIVKYNTSGTALWATRISAGFSFDYAISVDGAGNSYVMGSYSEPTITIYNADTTTFGSLTNDGSFDTFIVKYNSSGTAQWVTQIGGAFSEFGRSISVDSAGNSYVTGQYTSNPITFYNAGGSPSGITLTNSGDTDAFIVKYNTSGTAQWATRVAGSGFGGERGFGVSVDGSGNLYVTGSYYSNPVTIYNADTSTFGTLTNGSTAGAAFIVKYNTSGTAQWVVRIDGSGDQRGVGISVDAGGNVYIIGNYFLSDPLTFYNASGSPSGLTLTTSGGEDVFIVKYNTSGTAQWVTRIAGSVYDYEGGISVDDTGNLYVTGYYKSNPLTIYNADTSTFGTLTGDPSGDDDVFIVKYNTSGTAQWATRMGGSGDDQGRGIAVDRAGNSYITGSYYSNPVTIYNADTSTFGTLTNSGGMDVFIVKYSGDPPGQNATFNQSVGDITILGSNVSPFRTAVVNAGTLVGSMTGFSNNITTSGDITTGLGYIGAFRGDILGSGQFITNEYVGKMTSSVPIFASTVTGSVSANSLTAYTNNLSGAQISSNTALIGEIRSYANSIATGSLTASQVFVATMSFNDQITTSGNVTATTLIGSFTGLNVITSGTLTSSGGNLLGRLIGSNTVTLTDSVVSNALNGTIVTYANIIPATIVTSSNITAGSMNTFTNTVTVTRVSGSFVGPVATTGIDIFSSGSVIAKNFIGLVDAGSNSIITSGSVLTQQGIQGSINTFANNISTQGLITGTFFGKYNGNGPIESNANITVSGISNLFTLASNGTIFVQGTISGNYTGAVQTFGNSIVSTGGLSGNLIFARVTAYQNSIVNDGGISYGKNMLKSNYGNVASYSNAAPILTSISHYYSNVVSRQPWWSTTTSPTVSYVYTQGQTGYSSSVLMPDGRVVFVPSTSRSIGIFDTKTNIFSNVLPTGLTAAAGGWGWNSGVLLPNSNIAFIPGSNSYIGMYNPYLNTISLGPFITTADAFRGGVLLPNGNVVCIPYNTFSFTEFDPSNPSRALRNSVIGGAGNPPFQFSGTLLPNGNVICSPYSGNFVLYDYRQTFPAKSTDLIDNFFEKHAGSVLLPTGNVLCIPKASGYPLAQVSPDGVYSNAVSTVVGNGSYQNGCLLGHGKVLFGPGSGTNIGVYDIYSDTLTNIAIESGYGGITALPDGRAVLAPQTSLFGVALVSGVTQLNEHLSTSSYFNKF